MSRAQRIIDSNAYYHVMNRGAGRQKIFNDRVGRELFLQTLGEACHQFCIEVHAWCLMGNHYHLLIKTPQANLSRAMRHINGVYTHRYNRSNNALTRVKPSTETPRHSQVYTRPSISRVISENERWHF